MIVCENILLSGQRGPRIDQIATSTFYLPPIRAEAAEDVVYEFSIETLEGAPASASLGVFFEAAIRTTGGAVGDQSDFTDANPMWRQLNAMDDGALLLDGDWPTRMANQATTFPRGPIVRRIKGGVTHRLRVTPSYSGGTSPAFVMSCTAKVRYL
ncbi:hypothetical protein GYA93_15725 [Gordonia desulfuricans]|uniref:Uncharacterized protein n=1 Tax=Gordonia desulfuricans TaxID=89051 RepID=A0A7K3LSN2_9ACTN|nr:hypothetical protein [Gordonia desulfuricans]NDK91021.1 hypothetical protein [Gordonia desulfuricans]